MSSSQLLKTGRSVIQSEIDALSMLKESLGESFVKAINLLYKSEGRIIVSGMGKSGHIGRKIAATLSSTGSPAQFLHPAEASHGDLGVVTTKDTLLILSNSGETQELANLVAFAKRFSIKLIGVANDPNSSLIQNSKIGIILPQTGEACETGVVPSNSSVMLLALGDALAIALMKHRKFSVEAFREFHPGGQLGARLTQVQFVMHTGDSIPLVDANTPMPETLLMMSQKGFGVAGVVSEEGTLLGIITDGDLRRHMDGLLEANSGEVMTSSPVTISQNSLAEEALALMQEKKITCLFVLDNSSPARVSGILHIHDCLRLGVI
ncbi:MAG: KpsF/GutQ family sugar-phosphate isomerase [Rhodobacteraceae bacterium]|nr:KpsF/GutQ family sugar-phosphate isomerase [Paracoccaceae bacterium]